MDSVSLVSYLSPVRVSGPPEARDPNLMVLAALNPEKAPPAEIVSILNDILPPREFEEGGFKWRQVVSTKQVSRARARARARARKNLGESGRGCQAGRESVREAPAAASSSDGNLPEEKGALFASF